MISIAGFEQLEDQVFSDWKSGIKNVAKESEPAFSLCDNNQNRKEQVLECIRNFSVVNSTPLDCQQFLIKIQEQLNGTIQ